MDHGGLERDDMCVVIRSNAVSADRSLPSNNAFFESSEAAEQTNPR